MLLDLRKTGASRQEATQRPHRATTANKNELLVQHGINFNDVPTWQRHGIGRLVVDASIIRNRGKIQATIDNARAVSSASPSLAALAKSYEITRTRAPRSIGDLPMSTPRAEAFAKQLKSQAIGLSAPRACTRSCRTSASSTTTSTGASARPTTSG